MIRFLDFGDSIPIFFVYEDPVVFHLVLPADVSVESHFHKVDKSTTVTVFLLRFSIELQLHSLNGYSRQFHHSLVLSKRQIPQTKGQI